MEINFKGSIKQITSKQLVSSDRGVRLTIDIPVLPETDLDTIMEGLNKAWGHSRNESGELDMIISTGADVQV